MRECFLFTTYSDTELRLRTSVDNLKKISELGIDICIYSHYPITEEEQKLSNFSIYDKDNKIPEIDKKKSIFWNKYKNIKMEYYLPVIDYAIITQWVNGIKFLLNMGYDLIHVIPYDISLSKDVFEQYSKLTEGSSSLFKHDTLYPIQTYLFTVNRDGGEVISSITYDDYINSNEVFGENFLYQFLQPHIEKFKLVDYNDWKDLENRFLINSLSMGGDVFKIFNQNDCRLVVGECGGYVSYLLYNVIKPVLFTFGDSKYSVGIGDDLFIKSDIPFSDGLSDIKICVNGIDIRREIVLQYLKVKFSVD